MSELQPDSAFNSRAPSPFSHKLPALPPPDPIQPLDLDVPPPPPHKAHLSPSSSPSPVPSSQTLILPASNSLASAINAPMTPSTPTTPSMSDGGKPKRANPLTDLVDTEKVFVEQLTGIIRKVAAAWSRSNLPPPELDTMFRSIEAVYKASRGLYAKLKDISADPASAGALGGILLKWSEDLQKPYETYCNKYCSGFDSWEPVQNNQRLGPILASFSATTPAPSNSGLWTLDSLFLLPRSRLKYYLKLYNRLLKNTDNKLLVGPVEALNQLLDVLESRLSIKVGDSGSEAPLPPAPLPSPPQPRIETVDEIVIDMRNQSLSPPVPSNTTLRPLETDSKTGSETSSNNGSASGGERSSRESEATSLSRASTQTLSMPISDLERRLSTERTLDIFSMTPKAVKLQMSPPSLTFTREMRTSVDVVIRFTPRASGIEVVHQRGHIYLLSDLFLVCERMLPEERDKYGAGGPDMWLCYPPLAGKVLRVSEVEGQDRALQIAIMRKEFLILETDSLDNRNRLLTHFKECIEFSGSLPPPSKQPPPPLPINAYTQGRSDPSSAVSTPIRPQMDDRSSNNASPLRRPSPAPAFNQAGSSSELPPPAYQSADGKGRPDPSSLPPQPGPSFRNPQPFARGPPLGLMQNPPFPPPRTTSQHPGPNGESSNGANYPPPNAPYSAGPFPGHPIQQPMYPLNPSARGQFPPGGMPPPRPPSEPGMGPPSLHKPPSVRSLGSQYPQSDYNAPPLPRFQPGPPGPPGQNNMNQMPRFNSVAGGMLAPQARPMLPSQRSVSMAEIPFNEPSPPNSPLQEPQNLGPVISTISAQMKCKVFLQQQHAQWKSLGSAKLKLYRQEPTNVKQLVVEADNKDKSVLISTIVLTDGVERVGKTGVAIELSDKGARTGIVYMIQLRNEASAGGLFDSLLAGSDRAARG